MDYSMNMRIQRAIGNRHPHMAPHGCYRCRGEDSWVTIAVSSDEEWARLCQTMGKPQLADDPRFYNVLGRIRHREDLDAVVNEWTSDKDHYEVFHLLQEAGVAAGPVLTAAELCSDPHLKEREFFEETADPDAGTFSYPSRGFKLSRTPATTRRPAPLLGEHNECVLGKLLGLSEDELTVLEKEGIIGNIPKIQGDA
jgi:benzylsuccinate CoA-transferase BbsF subunit